jgi:hypothetical protein
LITSLHQAHRIPTPPPLSASGNLSSTTNINVMPKYNNHCGSL